MMNKEEWLKSLKVGDFVGINKHLGNPEKSSIERITKSQIILANGSRFKRRNGWQHPKSTWWNDVLCEITPEFEERHNHAIQSRRLSNNLTRRFDKLNSEKLKKINNVIEEIFKGA